MWNFVGGGAVTVQLMNWSIQRNSGVRFKNERNRFHTQLRLVHHSSKLFSRRRYAKLTALRQRLMWTNRRMSTRMLKRHRRRRHDTDSIANIIIGTKNTPSRGNFNDVYIFLFEKKVCHHYCNFHQYYYWNWFFFAILQVLVINWLLKDDCCTFWHAYSCFHLVTTNFTLKRGCMCLKWTTNPPQ